MICGRDALDLSAAIARREMSAEEVMRATLCRVAEVNGAVNAIVSLREEGALLAEARAADAGAPKGWLHGIPLAIKDLVNVAGLPTSKGSPLFAGEIAQTNDLIVERMRAAGAIVIGKTNTPEFGLGSHTFNPVHGTTRNPYDLTKSAGGSSGGAAAALATGMVCLADGSDMMGSLRNPAAWNNVYGLRPTWGLVPDEPGGQAFTDDLSTDGPMARSPADLAALLDTLAGPDPRVPFGRAHTAVLPQIDRLTGTPRLGWLGDWGGALAFEAGISGFCAAALEDMSGLGWDIEDIAPPFSSDALWQSWEQLRAHSHAMRRRADFDDPARRAHLKDAMLWEIARGRALSAEAVWDAHMIRSDWYRCAMALFERFDVLVLPSAQLWPFDADLEYPAEIAGVTMDTYHRWMQVVVPASLIGLPAVAVPCGFGPQGLPMGVQLIGHPGSDAHLLQIAQRWHQATGWPQKRPAMV
ncbi:amidase [Roseobacter ponti]|uniref:amidase n=1 Tax=Roseobacter ponti TaxID=1891787 RepID=UPI0024839A2F|nr:amidase [Roseobacter ponti]